MKGAEKKNAWYKTSWKAPIYINSLYACMAKLQLTLLSQHRARVRWRISRPPVFIENDTFGMHLQLFELGESAKLFYQKFSVGTECLHVYIVTALRVDRTLPYCLILSHHSGMSSQPSGTSHHFYDGLISKTEATGLSGTFFIHLISCCLSFLCYKVSKHHCLLVSLCRTKVWNAGCVGHLQCTIQDINARRQSTSESCTIKRLRIISLLIREKWKY